MGEATFTTPPLCSFRVAGITASRMECRPISDTAPNNTVSIMYRREGDKLRQCGVGAFIDGVWLGDRRKPLNEDGLCWSRFVDD